MELVTALSENPFDLATTPIGKVMQLNGDNAGFATQLVKTTGIVTYKAPDMLFLQQGEDGIRVLPARRLRWNRATRWRWWAWPNRMAFHQKLPKRSCARSPIALCRPRSRWILLALNQDNTPSGQDADPGADEATYLGMSANDSLRSCAFARIKG